MIMALDPNHRFEQCRVLAQEIVDLTGCTGLLALHLAARVGHGQMTRDEAFERGWTGMPQGVPN